MADQHGNEVDANDVQPQLLRAGALTLLHENGDVRYIRLGDQEIVRRIYVAVRDPNWGTIPARLTFHEVTVQPDSFTIRFHAEHKQGEIDFSWDGVILGGADSSLTLTMEGIAHSTFLKNRIGICILHPMSLAGVPCTVEHVDGSLTNGAFPVAIEPHTPFRNIGAIQHEVSPGLLAVVRFGGDIFEMEDQRNWTDASYKTYSTPIDLPMPTEIRAGMRVQQSVWLRLMSKADSINVSATPAPAMFTVAPQEVVGRLPRLGLSSAGHGQPLTEGEIERLRLLHLAHLRADVRFDQRDWQAFLRQQIDEARQLGAALEVALHLPDDDPDAVLAALRQVLDEQQPTVARWLVFRQGHSVTPPGMAAAARHHLGDYNSSARFAGGTDAYFVHLNRNRPALDGLDLLTYSINPQVHAFDNASMVETLPAQAETLASARRFSDGRGVMVSQVTLKYRNNPDAIRPRIPLPGELPPQVDPRQRLPFAAGWTLGSIKYLGEGGAESVTYYETTGWLGVMEQEQARYQSAQFPSQPGEVFPLFHALAGVGEWADAEIVRATSSHPLSFDALALRRGGALRVLVANYTAETQRVPVQGLDGEGTLVVLDENSLAQATGDPEGFRSNPGDAAIVSDNFRLELAPFALARLDLIHTTGDLK